MSALSSLFPLHVPPLSPSRFQPFTFVSQLLCPAILYICLPALGCVSLAIPTFVSQLWTAVSASAVQSFTFVSQLWAAVSASAFQSSTFVSQRWAAVSASAWQSLILHVSPSSDSCIRLCLAILYLSPSCGLHVDCNPLHLSPCVYICLPALDCCGRLCLAISSCIVFQLLCLQRNLHDRQRRPRVHPVLLQALCTAPATKTALQVHQVLCLPRKMGSVR